MLGGYRRCREEIIQQHGWSQTPWASCSRVSQFSQGETHAFCGRGVGAMCAESLQCMASVGDPWGSTQRQQESWEMLGSRGRMVRFDCCWAKAAGVSVLYLCFGAGAAAPVLAKLPLSTEFFLPHRQGARCVLRSISLPHVCSPHVCSTSSNEKPSD